MAHSKVLGVSGGDWGGWAQVLADPSAGWAGPASFVVAPEAVAFTEFQAGMAADRTSQPSLVCSRFRNVHWPVPESEELISDHLAQLKPHRHADRGHIADALT